LAPEVRRRAVAGCGGDPEPTSTIYSGNQERLDFCDFYSVQRIEVRAPDLLSSFQVTLFSRFPVLFKPYTW